MIGLESTFVLPSWIKRQDIKDHWVKWNKLFIELNDGRQYEINPVFDANDDVDGWKNPINKDEDFEEEEAEYEDEELEPCLKIKQD